MSPIRTGILVLVLAALPAASHGQTAAPVDAFQCNAGVDYAMQSTGWVQTQVLDYAAGLPKADECVRLFPTDATVFGKRADVHWGLGDLERAVADLTKASELAPGASRWLTTRGDIRAEAEQDELALADYEAALRVDATDSMALLGRAQVRRYLGDLAGSIRDFDAVLARINDDDAVYFFAQLAYEGLGFARLDNGEPGLAIEAFTRALERYEYMEQSYYGRAQAYERTGDRAAAVADMTQLLDRFDPNAHYFERRGSLNQDLGNREAAIADLNEALRLDPTLTGVQERLNALTPPPEPEKPTLTAEQYAAEGRRLGAQNDLPGAQIAFDGCIRLKPDEAACWAFRGSIRGLLGDMDGSKNDFDEALRLKPREAGIYFMRGMMYLQLTVPQLRDYRSEAISDFRQGLVFDPNNRAAQEALRRLGVEP